MATTAELCASDADARHFTCSCEHVSEDHVPTDFDDLQPCAVDGCPCNRFKRMTAFGWTLRAVGPIA